MMLGDLEVIGEPPAKLAKALAVVAHGLHRAYAQHPLIKPGISHRSCVLCSLTVRDFLFRIGFHDAEVAPVLFAIRARKDGAELHSLGVGDPNHRLAENAKGDWPGHMVVLLPTTGWLIDTTLYQAQRPQWPGLAGMMAIALLGKEAARLAPPIYGLQALAGFGTADGEPQVDAWWAHQPRNKFWRRAGDADRKRRHPAVAALIHAFGKWEDQP